jgi:hypothetical protein
MSNHFGETLPSALVHFLPGYECVRLQRCQQIYEANRHRIYSFAFWMTEDEMVAENISIRAFARAFSVHDEPSDEAVDRALVRELRATAGISLGQLCLNCDVVRQTAGIRRNTLRVELERAIMGLPPTERMIFCMHDGDACDHARIARTLGISEDASRNGLLQARLRIRELVQASSFRAAA